MARGAAVAVLPSSSAVSTGSADGTRESRAGGRTTSLARRTTLNAVVAIILAAGAALLAIFTTWMLTVLAVVVLVAFIAWRVLAEQRVVLASVQALKAGADRAARGNYSEPLPVDGPGELAALADALNVMMRTAREREALLVEQALRDPLTELGNRTLLQDRLANALARRRAPETRLVFMLIDLDGFKHVNDTQGHFAGDEALRIVAQRLSGALRQGDTLARLGGDEFAIVADDIRGDGAHLLAQRVLNVLREPFVVAGRSVVLTASLGMVDGLDGDESSEDLLRAADIAMYRAKRAGGDQVCVADRPLTGSVSVSVAIEPAVPVASTPVLPGLSAFVMEG